MRWRRRRATGATVPSTTINHCILLTYGAASSAVVHSLLAFYTCTPLQPGQWAVIIVAQRCKPGCKCKL
jgi:hypothetical protein